MRRMRIVFMGSPEFAVPSLEAVNAAGHELVAVVTGTDKRRGRGSECSATPVKKRALELGIPVIEADSMRDLVLEDRLRSLHADLFIVVAFKVLPKTVLSIPNIGSVNVHASLLPKYRGAAPIHWAIKRGETETGVTIFFLDEQVDTGKYLLQVRVPIGAEDTTGDLYRVLMRVGAESLGKAIALISGEAFTLTAQDDSQATSAPKLFQEDAKIDFSWSAAQIVNHVRGMNPFPMAWVYLDGKKLKVLRVRGAEGERCFPEKSITVDEHRMVVGTSDGHVEFLEVQLEGKKVTHASDFIRGYQGAYELG
jgi:methionyl-tRNA formyltransferase